MKEGPILDNENLGRMYKPFKETTPTAAHCHKPPLKHVIRLITFWTYKVVRNPKNIWGNSLTSAIQFNVSHLPMWSTREIFLMDRCAGTGHGSCFCRVVRLLPIMSRPVHVLQLPTLPQPTLKLYTNSSSLTPDALHGIVKLPKETPVSLDQ